MSNAYNKDGSIVIHKTSAVGPSTSMLDIKTVKTTRPGKAFIDRTPYVRTERKIGRNDPCPCRSGLKFKKCHGG